MHWKVIARRVTDDRKYQGVGVGVSFRYDGLEELSLQPKVFSTRRLYGYRG
jgi:hypothetical protein